MECARNKDTQSKLYFLQTLSRMKGTNESYQQVKRAERERKEGLMKTPMIEILPLKTKTCIKAKLIYYND